MVFQIVFVGVREIGLSIYRKTMSSDRHPFGRHHPTSARQLILLHFQPHHSALILFQTNVTDATFR